MPSSWAHAPYYSFGCPAHQELPSFPTRRSSDLVAHYLVARAGTDVRGVLPLFEIRGLRAGHVLLSVPYGVYGGLCGEDRKSTRLNSSHSSISYAVFCWKKKSEWRSCTGACARSR